MNQKLNLSSGPHVRDLWSTRFIMLLVTISLLPATAVGVWVHGWNALWVVLAAVISAVATEFIFDVLTGRPDTWKDCSAIVTGLMLALTLSPSVPLYIPIIGSVFAIGVVKCCFGGLGKNFINPALAARCFLHISFLSDMTEFMVDGVSMATPMELLKNGRVVNITQMFLGNTNGVIGGSVLALLIGGLFLWSYDVIHGQICFSVLGGFTVFLILFGGHGLDLNFLAAHLCGGGVIIGAFYMATDYVTSPVSRLGQTIYGITIGVLGAMFRVFGNAADSFSYSVIFGNLLTPLIDTYIVSKPYAFRKKSIRIQNGEVPKPLLQRIPKPVIALAVIALVSGLALSGAFTATKDTIEVQRAAKAAEAYRSVIPGAEQFSFLEELTEPYKDAVYGEDFGKVTINAAVEGKDAAGNVVGYAVSATSSEGYEGDITVAVGILPDGTVTGISYTELNETKGKGSKCGEPAFMDQFKQKQVAAFELGGSGEAGIDGVSGATYSSAASVNAVNAALDFYHNVIKGGE